MDAQLLTVLIGRHRSELTFVFPPWFGIPGVGMLFAGSRLTTRSGVGRSLSLVDNIRCLHQRLSDDRFGGIRLETGEQATSPTPSTSQQHQIGNHQH